MNRVRSVVHCEAAHQKKICGRGVGIAVIDTGLSLHPDYRSRITGWLDTMRGRLTPYDDCGHGSHVAGIAAGSGMRSKGIYTGIAPEADLVGIKVLDQKGNGHIPQIMRGMDWILREKERLHIRIVNISIGAGNNRIFPEESSFVKKVDELWDAGIVVVAAAGNKGPGPMTICAPGNSRKIITVGSYDAGIQKRAVRSGAGPTSACIKKPDVVAPGFHIISCSSYDTGPGTAAYQQKSGTSMSTPVVSGAIALLLCRYPDMTPREVKIRLKNTCRDLHLPHEKQGWGMLDIPSLLGLS